jgi:hypothetical protein
MELSHYFAYNASALYMSLIGAKSHLGHLKEDSAVDRL